ncbi:MAG: HmuY family protein [Saprospiraceae bacterium]|nr:HmuY family protein [Candidatus Vicinibacter affinis]
MKYFFPAMLLFAFILGVSSCNDDEDNSTSTVSSVNVKDLPADPTTGFDPTTGMPVGDKKIFTFFRLADSSIVPNSDSATTKWDIGFRGSTIITNGGSSGPGQEVHLF